MDRLLSIILLVLVINCSYAQDVNSYAWHYVTGNNVNVRISPNLESGISSQSNWGDKYRARKYNENWFQAYAWDEGKFIYIHSDYMDDFEGFVEKALNLQDRNSKTELLIIDHYIENQKYDSAIELAIKLIEKSPEETILISFEECRLVSHSAFQKVFDPAIDEETRQYIRVKLKENIKNPTILTLIELTGIEELIKNKEYNNAYERLNKILEEKSDFLYIKIDCDYDVESKVYPQFCFKNLYFINYHLMPLEGKKKVMNYLNDAVKNWENGWRKEIAVDIQRKLWGIWEIN